MKIFGFPLSPFVRKVIVALSEKGIAFDLEPSNPQAPSEAFAAASPFKKIPAMEDRGFMLADSTAIVTYLEAKYPEVPLLPQGPEARGRAIWFEEVSDTVLIPAGAPVVVNRFLRPRIFGTEGDEAAALAAEEAIKKPLGYLEEAVSEKGWMDTEFSIGDIAVASTLKTMSYAGWQLDPAAYPRLVAWYERVQAREGWQAAAAREQAIFSAAGF